MFSLRTKKKKDTFKADFGIGPSMTRPWWPVTILSFSLFIICLQAGLFSRMCDCDDILTYLTCLFCTQQTKFILKKKSKKQQKKQKQNETLPHCLKTEKVKTQNSILLIWDWFYSPPLLFLSVFKMMFDKKILIYNSFSPVILHFRRERGGE